MDNVKRKVTIDKLNLPVDDYNYDVKLLTSIDGGQTFYYSGFGRFARTLKEAQAIKADFEKHNGISMKNILQIQRIIRQIEE